MRIIEKQINNIEESRDYLKGQYLYTIITGPGISETICDYHDYPEQSEVNVDLLKQKIDESFKDFRSKKGLAEYIRNERDLEKIISILPPTPCDKNGRELRRASVYDPFLSWMVYTRESLTSQEIKALFRYIEGQCADGWGEGFEQRPINIYQDFYDDDDEDEYGNVEIHYTNWKVHYSPWRHPGWTIKILEINPYAEENENKKKKIVEVEEEIKIKQKGYNVILEKGDKIEIIRIRNI